MPLLPKTVTIHFPDIDGSIVPLDVSQTDVLGMMKLAQAKRTELLEYVKSAQDTLDYFDMVLDLLEATQEELNGHTSSYRGSA